MISNVAMLLESMIRGSVAELPRSASIQRHRIAVPFSDVNIEKDEDELGEKR